MPDFPSRPKESAAERSDIHPRPVLWGAASILLVLALVPAACWGLLKLWQVPLEAGSNRPVDFRTAAPRLQGAPQQERAAYFAEKERLLHGYAWVDRERGTVRIPIEVAMEAMIARNRASGARRGEGGEP